MKSPPVKKPARKWRIAAVVLCLVLGAALYIGRLIWTHAIVAQSIPPQPSGKDLPPEFGYRLSEAEDLARGYRTSAAGLIALGRLYHANGFVNEALGSYEGLRRIEPRNPHWPYLEAVLLAGYGRASDAVPLYRRAVSLAPKYLPIEIKLGDTLLKSDQATAAAVAYNQALELESDNPYALLGLARVAVGRSEWTNAKQLLEQAFARHPNFNRGLDLLVNVDEHIGAQAEANELRNQITSVEFSDIADPWLDDLVNDCYDPYRISVAADVYKSYGDSQTALQLLDRAISLAPTAGSYRRQRGLILFDLHEYNKARSDTEAACSLAPEDPYAWTAAIKVLAEQKDQEGVWRALAEGLRNCPLSADLHLTKARQLNAVGSHEEAIVEFNEAHRLWPSEAGPLVELANTYFAVNDADKALNALKEALQSQPENPSALAALTIYSIEVGDKPNALNWWNRLRRLSRIPAQVTGPISEAFQKKFGESAP